MRYEWDETKNRSNFAKRGLDFKDAEQVFGGSCVTFEDNRFDYGEERLITLGVLAGRVVVIAHAPREKLCARLLRTFAREFVLLRVLRGSPPTPRLRRTGTLL